MYRGRRLKDNLSVVIKTLGKAYPSKEIFSRLELEYSILSRLDHEGIIKAYATKNFKSSFVIIMEDFGDVSLKEMVSTEKLDVKEFLELALQIVDIVGYIHENNIIHKDLNPSNILVNVSTRQLKLIDFGSSSLVAYEHATYKSSNELKGTVSYISPEQTERINSDVDYRSDFYSLGITFYEMLTGELPFRATDILELVHNHIAKDIERPVHRFPEIPNVLWDIILKMTEKDKRDRYQSIVGIRKDLELCQKKLKEVGSIEDFDIGKHDLSSRLEIPKLLYGREDEIKTLLDGFYHSTDGNEAICLIGGKPGVGKTALVKEIHKSVIEKKGYFISGKFEQFQQDLIYFAVVNALKKLVKQLLSESESRLERWKRLILEAVGPNGQLIIEAIPEVKKIIGDQPEPQVLNSKEAKNRFMFTFRDFIRVFAKKEHPLVIFLDDLQWADMSTINLIETLASYRPITYFYFIGTYRNDEVKSGHPLLFAIDELKKNRIVKQIHLQPLNESDINRIVADTLSSDEDKVKIISSVLLKKTEGNPYYLKELFKSFYTDNLIWFDTSKRLWDFDQEAIAKVEVSSNVVEYMIEKLNKLPIDCVHILKIAACIGTQFDLHSVANIMNEPTSKVISLFEKVVKEEIIQPIDYQYRIEFIKSSDLDIKYISKFSFVHDRVQQAVYHLLDNNMKRKVHLAYGKFLLQKSEQDDESVRLIDTVYHLNEGRFQITDIYEKDKLCRLNLKVGLKARNASAFHEAYNYLKVGLELLPTNPWGKAYELSFSMVKEFSECAYLAGHNDIAEEKIQVLLSHAKTELERLKVLSILTQQYSTLGKMEKSIDIGLEGLKLSGLKLSKHPNSLVILKELMLIKWNQGNRKIYELEDSPKMTDEKLIAVFGLMMETLTSVYLTGNKNLFVLLVLKMVNFSLRYGNCSASAFAFSGYGMLLCSVFNNPKDGHEFGKLSMTLNERYPDPKIECRIFHGYTDFIFHWANHWSEMTPLQKKGIKIGYQSGDFLYTSYIAHHNHMWNPQLMLDEMLDKKNMDRDIIKETGYLDALNETDLFINTCRNYMNITEDKYSLDYESFTEKKCLDEMKKNNFTTGITAYHIWKAEIYTFYEVYDKAIEHIEIAKLTIGSVMGLPYIARFSLTTFLAYAGQYKKMNNQDKKLGKKRMKKEYKQIKKWAKFCPSNFQHIQLIMGAELERVSGKPMKALELYNQSIVKAHENKWLRDEALANELAARFFLELGEEKGGVGYLHDSYYLYDRWGATRKVKDMEKKYPHLLFDKQIVRQQTNQTGISTMPNTSTPSVLLNNSSSTISSLDFSTILKSSQAISNEIVLENFLKKMMKIVIENAGAQRGYFITKTNKNLVIHAKASLTKETVDVKLNVSAEDYNKLPKNIINYVARNHEKIVIYNATQEDTYQDDEYIKVNQVKSILCIPLLRHNQLGGILYLENNLTAGAFTVERIRVLEVLTSNILISLENARLYRSLEEHNSKLEQQVAERTKELSVKNSALKEKNQKLEETQKELKLLAMTDPLTKLLNRRSMMEKLLYEELRYRRSKRTFTIILIDIDNFKVFNDQYGHNCGDFILQLLAQEMQSFLRAQDIVSRWGGEEFLILLPETDRDGGLHLAEKLRQKISDQLFIYQNINLSISLTLGVTTYDTLEDIEECIKLADKGLYEGKNKGKNCVVFMDDKI
ncbi:diguanylate cyclase [Psychrilyobacter piezotolerans]|uniref:Diguanylate cyclase n=1 Tax=Psychrilyobacter piezotolerans TaxID=2293438 RepID=A0ABX9KFU8_9FUSO|nr:diguanylate cyclase [Psychrilyobacter piezotolerans]RDE60658.1 diguanylate cyclase [Psychrilyobacter sp. S5]REI40585.1 diguanylate cyclase [Psychrilyobacter piezotolerans]